MLVVCVVDVVKDCVVVGDGVVVVCNRVVVGDGIHSSW